MFEKAADPLVVNSTAALKGPCLKNVHVSFEMTWRREKTWGWTSQRVNLDRHNRSHLNFNGNPPRVCVYAWRYTPCPCLTYLPPGWCLITKLFFNYVEDTPPFVITAPRLPPPSPWLSRADKGHLNHFGFIRGQRSPTVITVKHSFKSSQYNSPDEKALFFQ